MDNLLITLSALVKSSLNNVIFKFKLLTEVKAERLRMDKILADLESEKAKRDRPKEKSPSFSPSPIDTNHVPASMSATTLSGMSELRHDILDDLSLGIPQLEVVGIYSTIITCRSCQFISNLVSATCLQKTG